MDENLLTLTTCVIFGLPKSKIIDLRQNQRLILLLGRHDLVYTHTLLICHLLIC